MPTALSQLLLKVFYTDWKMINEQASEKNVQGIGCVLI
jgi:hypothetical protein